MKKIALTFLLIVIVVEVFCISHEEGDLVEFFFGEENNCEYDNWVSHVSEKQNFNSQNTYAPFDVQTNGFGQFTMASSQQLTSWQSAVDLFFNEEYELAQETLIASNIPYKVVGFIYNDQEYMMLREDINLQYNDDNNTDDESDDELGAFDFGWGIFIYNPASGSPAMVSVPHPNDSFVGTYLSVQAFLDCNCKYLMINGTGRELNTNQCDPTRNSNHPYVYFYEKAANQIRLTQERHEIALQFESYDWDKHEAMASVQLSGKIESPLGLPVRDWSSSHNDVIQNTDYIVFEEDYFGNNSLVNLNEYYGLYEKYSIPTIYHDSLFTSGPIDIVGYTGSSLTEVNIQDYNYWSSYSPFIHIAVDEFPNCFEQTEENYFWFYGYNNMDNTWDWENRYSNCVEYYHPFMTALNEALNCFTQMEDGDNLPPAVTNLNSENTFNGVKLSWQGQTPYDFDSYLLYVSETPISNGNYTVYDSSEENGLYQLGFPGTKNVLIEDLNVGTDYYFAIAQRDVYGNVSEISNESNSTTLQASFNRFRTIVKQDTIVVEAFIEESTNCSLFRLYRKEEGQEYQELYSGNYINRYYDSDIENDLVYSYKVCAISNLNELIQVSPELTASCPTYHKLQLSGGNLLTDFTFGKSSCATDGYDLGYDQNYDTMNSFELYSEIDYLQVANGQVEREVIGEFDSNETYHKFDLHLYAPYIGTSDLVFSMSSDDLANTTDKFYISYNNELYNLREGDIQLSVETTNHAFELYWGNLPANVSFANDSGIISGRGISDSIEWTSQFPELVDSYSVYFKNEQDSILVADNLSSDISSIDWEYQGNETIRSINCYVMVHTLQGQDIVFKNNHSSLLLGNLDNIILDNEESSNWLVSYPFSQAQNINEISNLDQVYSFNNGEYLQQDNIINNEGYLAVINGSVEISILGECLVDENTIFLNQGWNLIANPHPIEYNVSDLLFYYGNTFRSPSYVITQEAISPYFMGIRNDSYSEIRTIKSYESVFVYVLTDEMIGLQFNPNHQENFNITEESGQYASLEFSTITGAKDQITIGVSGNQFGQFDTFNQLVKPPSRPISGLNEVCLLDLNDESIKLQKQLLPQELDGEYSWNYAFTNSQDANVQVKIVDHNLNSNSSVELALNGQIYNITENPITIDCNNTPGNYQGCLYLDSPTSNSHDSEAVTGVLSVYPNPSSKKFNIEVVSSKSNYQVSIYNIKGQRVKKFNVRDNKSSRNTLTWGKDNSLNNIASGIYFVKYSDKDTSDIRKICLIK